MDIGYFKASRARLLLWVLIPPILIAVIGLTSFALNQQSKWALERTKSLSEILPKVVAAQQNAEALIDTFNASEVGRIKTEGELISFLQDTANKAECMVDVKVERNTSAAGNDLPVLTANVRGAGTLAAMQVFLGDISSRQQLLSETSLQISQEGESCRAEITFELILFNHNKPVGGV